MDDHDAIATWDRWLTDAPDPGSVEDQPLEAGRELVRLGERAARWFSGDGILDTTLDVETSVKCIDGALGALEATSSRVQLTERLRRRFGVTRERATNEGFSDAVIAEIVACVVDPVS